MLRALAQDLDSHAGNEQIRLAGQRLVDTAAGQIRDREQLMQLRDSLSVLPPSISGEHPWAVVGPGSNRWLVSSAGAPGGTASVIVVVRLSAFRARVESLPLLRASEVRLTDAAAENVEPLGSRIPAPEPAILAREETLERRRGTPRRRAERLQRRANG